MGQIRGKKMRLLDLDVLLKQRPNVLSTTTGDSAISFHQLIIIDWDDTLNPSTWCVRSGVLVSVEPTDRDVDTVRELASRVADTISLCMKWGHVVIVTNAESGWVELSAGALMPEVELYGIFSFRSCSL